MNSQVLCAIFKRNFFSYFSNPTGYLFICAFVLLCSFATTWPPAFFASNLANLDQLNAWLPWILVIFIPTITMGIWSEERQEGTDELLLTLPASDLDVVMGKYLAAVAIYTVALVFSLVNVGLLATLGDPDWGLVFANYVGYWLVGIAMLAIGMVASFLTSSNAVAFIFGLALTAPLVFTASTDVALTNLAALFGAGRGPSPESAGAMAQVAAMIVSSLEGVGEFLKTYSVVRQFEDFGRGLIPFSGVVYFLSATTVALYISMVLIGRRHWYSGRDNESMGWHYLVRSVSVIAVAIGLNLMVARLAWAYDASAAKLNSLTSKTLELLAELKRPVNIEAFISPQVPERYVSTRLNLISLLNEVNRRGGDKVVLKIYNTEPFSREAAVAEDQFGIRAREVESSEQGSQKLEEIYLGVVFTSGSQKVIVPFFDRGIPAEYEIVRSITTVSQAKRKKIGVVTTDARLFGGLDFSSFQQFPDQRIIEELRKQYDVAQVDASSPIAADYDMLFVVQPSTLGPEQMEHLVKAVESGLPTAIFEDPFPYLDPRTPGTSQPRARPGGPMSQFGMGGPPPPKGDIQKLWDVLQVDLSPRSIIWQSYNPHPRLEMFPDDFVFIGPPTEQWRAFNRQDPTSAELQELLFLRPGEIIRRPKATLEFTPLVVTSQRTGTIDFDEFRKQREIFFNRLSVRRENTGLSYILAARVRGKAEKPSADKPTGTESANGSPGRPIHAIVVGDIDLMYSDFFAIRERGFDADSPFLNMDLDNVSFVLNIVDSLAGEDRFLEIRNRRRRHRTLVTVEEQTKAARTKVDLRRRDLRREIAKAREDGEKALSARLAELQKKAEDDVELLRHFEMARRAEQQKLDATVARKEREAEQEIKETERNVALEIRQIQDRLKLVSAMVPPILPMILAVVVFFVRRLRETEGVSTQRLR